MADILRQVADMIDDQPVKSVKATKTNMTMKKLTPVEVEKPEDAEGNVMIPPLQSKLELLKKSVGVDNVYDKESSSDELDVIKKNAGLAKAVRIEASEDNDITG